MGTTSLAQNPLPIIAHKVPRSLDHPILHLHLCGYHKEALVALLLGYAPIYKYGEGGAIPLQHINQISTNSLYINTSKVSPQENTIPSSCMHLRISHNFQENNTLKESR